LKLYYHSLKNLKVLKILLLENYGHNKLTEFEAEVSNYYILFVQFLFCCAFYNMAGKN